MALRFDVVTLFPELFEAPLKAGVTRRAFGPEGVDVRLWNLRDHAEGGYRRVDDRPFGGGPGMVLMAEPLRRCLQAIETSRSEEVPLLVHFSPAGQRLDQTLIRGLAAGSGAILLCGRYEGIDQRLLDHYPQRLEISLGDFVLSGGELAALVVLDATARLQPGVLNDPESHRQDSFEGDGLLDCPHYSRPEVWPEGSSEPTAQVPEVLLSGHHERIAQWRREQSLALTARRRPDLVEAARARGALDARDERFLARLPSPLD